MTVRRRLTLSFDNGPDPSVTPLVLRELAARDLSATFFVVGDQVRKPGGRRVLTEIAAAGHTIGNHSMTHTVPLGRSPGWPAVQREISDTQQLLGQLAEKKLFRPFGSGGHLGPELFSAEAVEHLVTQQYTVALWNSVPRDWEDADGWCERALNDIQRRQWTLLVLHDIAGEAMTHLGAFLDSVLEDDVEVTPDLPPECVPIRNGEITTDIGAFITKA